MSDVGVRAERAEAAAWRDLHRAAPAALGEALGLEAHAVADGLALVARRLDAAEFNRAFGLGLERPVDESDLDGVLALYAPLGLASARLQLSPAAQPRTLIEGWLAARGLVESPLSWAKFARRAAPDPPSAGQDLTLVACAAAEGEVFADTVCAGFGMPPALRPWLAALVGRPDWRTYLAFDGETPAAAAAMHLGPDWVWLGLGATRPEMRRRGGQGALMARRIRDAAALGRTWVFTETGAPTPDRPDHPSYRNMLRCGFEELYRRPNWVIPRA